MRKFVKKLSMLTASVLGVTGAVCGLLTLKSQSVVADTVTTNNMTAVYSSTTHNSSNLQTLNISSFTGVSDFNKYFSFTYDDEIYDPFEMSDVVSYKNNKINIKNDKYAVANDNGRSPYFGIQFHPDGVMTKDSYYGKTSLGNFEVKITLDGVDPSNGENIYFGSRITTLDGESLFGHPSDLYLNNVRLQARLTGSDDGAWTMSSSADSLVYGKNHHFANDKVTNGMTVTVGFINNYCYMYADTKENGTTILKDGDVMIAKVPLMEVGPSQVDGNESFVMYFTGSKGAETEINISSFSYRRLDSAFDYDADDSTSFALVRKENPEGVARWTNGEPSETETNKSQYLEELYIDKFTTNEDFYKWFSLDYQSRNATEGVNYTTTASNGNLTIEMIGTNKAGFRLLPNENSIAELGNFEVKIGFTGATNKANANIYFGSRIHSYTNQLQDNGLKAIFSNGNGLTSWGATSTNYTGANTTVSSGTLTVGFIDNACYYYVGDKASDLSNVSIIKKNYSANEQDAYNANQVFAIYFHEGAKLTMTSFSYRRLNTEKFPYNAKNVTADASVTEVRTYLGSGDAKEVVLYPEATFSGDTKTSATVQTVNMPEMKSLHSFTDYFKLAYNDRTSGTQFNDGWHTWSTLAYNKQNKSVKIIVPQDGIGNTEHTEWRFMPEGDYDSSYLGNYEMTITLKTNPDSVATNRNIYIGNYNISNNNGYESSWSSANYSGDNALFRLTGGALADGTKVWTVNNQSSNIVPVGDKVKVTIGFVNGLYYSYVNNPTRDYFVSCKQDGLQEQTQANKHLEGNQLFALTLTEGSEVEICSFTYERLTDDALVESFNIESGKKMTQANMKNTDEYKYVEKRMAAKIRAYELGVLQTQEYNMLDGASVRFSDPYGLRFAATFQEKYINFWEKERGYKVELGALIAPTSIVTPNDLRFESSYVLDRDYIQIVCETPTRKYAIIDGYARVNCVLKVSLPSNYERDFVGVSYLRILDEEGNVVYTKYATGGIYYYLTTNGETTATQYVADTKDKTVRNMKFVVQEALKDATAHYTEAEKTYLLGLETGAKVVIDRISQIDNSKITDENVAEIRKRVVDARKRYEALTAYTDIAGLEMSDVEVKALVKNYNKLVARENALQAYDEAKAQENGGNA